MAELLALVPIVLLLVCMAGFGWSAAAAGVLSAATAGLIAIFAFDYDAGLVGLAGPLLEAGFTTATIIWIVFPALTLHEVQMRSGASARIGSWLTTISDRPEVLVLILAWFFALLLEGAAGFGTPVALVAPMLVALGIPAERALVLALLGHAVGVSFGAVGTPIIPLLEVSNLEPAILSLAIMFLHAILGWVLVLAVFRLAQAPNANAVVVPVATICFMAPAILLAGLTGPELPTLGGALLGGTAFILWANRRWPAEKGGDAPAGRAIALAALPYGLVLVAVLTTRTIPALKTALQSVVLEWGLADRFAGTVSPLYHPGTMLMIAVIGTAVFVQAARAVLLPSMARAARRLPMVALALVSVLLLSRIMVHSGMIRELAGAAAGLFDSGWPAAVPLVAALGSFITGSGTASNILLGGFQLAAAEVVGLAPLLALAGQGFGSAIGNIVAPHNIVAGAATVGLVGREGAALKATLPICLAYAALGGVLLFLLEQAG